MFRPTPISFNRSVRLSAFRGAFAAASVLLAMAGSAAAQVSITPAATGSILFPDTTLGATSNSQATQFQLTTAQPVTFTVPASVGGSQEFFVDTVSGCVADGTTVNPAGTICTIGVKFFPAYPGQRDVPLLATTNTGTYRFGLSGFGVEPGLSYVTNAISTVAGNGFFSNFTSGVPALQAGLATVFRVTTDYAGNLYLINWNSNSATYSVIKIDAVTGLANTIPGPWPQPIALALDGAGNLYVADSLQKVIYRDDLSSGSAVVYIGGGASTADGVSPLSVQLDSPTDFVVNPANGNFYFLDGNLVRKLDGTTGLVSTIAGTTTTLPHPVGIALDHANHLYVTTLGFSNNQGGLWQFDLGSSTLTPILSGLDHPDSLAIDAAGNLYFSLINADVVEKIPAGSTTPAVFAGSDTTPTTAANDGDGGAPTLAHLLQPRGLAVDSLGSLYIADESHFTVRKVSMTSNSVVTALYLAPSNIDFGIVPVGTTGNSWTITVNNTTGSVVRLASIGLSDSIDFTETNNCGVTLQPYTNCNVLVSFKPQTDGIITGTLIIVDSSTHSPQTVFLIGTGNLAASLPSVVLSPSTIDFGTQTAGTSSNPWTITLSNTSGNPLTISSFGITSATGGFNTTQGNCIAGGVLPAYSTCTMQLSFSALAEGTYTGTFSFNDNAPDSPQTISLTGIASGSAVVLAPGSIDFGNQAVGTTSNTWTVTVNNTSGTDQTLSGPINVTGPFTQTNTCGTTLPAHSTCNVLVAFAPTATGAATGTLNVPVTGLTVTPVPLTGMGTTSAPVVFFAPTNIDFGTQTVGTTSNSWTVTLNNTSGSVANFLSPITVTGPFTETDNCGTSLAAYTTCNVVVAFAPAFSGPATGQMSVIVNGVSTPLTVALTGIGSAATPVLVFAPTNVDFGSQPVGTPANPWTVTLNNISDFPAPLSIPVSITGSGDFTQSNNCGNVVPAHTTCNVLVIFTPSSTGPVTGQLTTTTSGGTTLTVAITGIGTNSTPVVTFSPTNIDFGSQPVGTPANPWTVTLNNQSGSTVPLSLPLSITGDPSFTQTNNCGTTLPPYSTCNVLVTFTPSAAGVVTGQLVALPNGGTPLTVALTGLGTSSTPVVIFSPTSIDFGNQPANTTSNPWTVNVSNTSGTAVTFSAPISIIGSPVFTQTNNCGTTLAAYSSCSMQVTFAPNISVPQGITIPFVAQIIALINGSATPLTVALTGTEISSIPTVTFSTSNVDFGDQTVGTTSNPWTITLNNTGNTDATFLTPLVLLGAPFFTQTNNCGSGLAAHSTCNIQVTFAPTIAGTFPALLEVLPTNLSTPQTVNITGTGINAASPALVFGPSTFDFGNQMVGTSNTWTVTLNNTGDTATTFALPVTLLGPPYFTQTNNCGTGLAAHATCTIQVSFAPGTAGLFTGQLIVLQSGPYPPQYLNFTGTGVAVTSVVFFAPTSIDFGSLTVGNIGNPWTVTLNNTTGFPITFGGIALTDTTNFNQTNNCGTTLPAYSTCTVQVKFTPTTGGVLTASLTALINGVPETVPLTGTATIPPDYSLVVTPSIISLAAGQTGLATFTFTPVGGYVGTVSFSCFGLPTGATCTFNPPSVTANGSNTVQTAQLIINTTGPFTGTISSNRFFGGRSETVLATIFLPGALLCGLLGLRRRKLRGALKHMALLMLLLAVIGGVNGCGGFTRFTPTGHTTVTVTSSASSSGTATGGTTTTTTHTAAFTLNITQ